MKTGKTQSGSVFRFIENGPIAIQKKSNFKKHQNCKIRRKQQAINQENRALNQENRVVSSSLKTNGCN
jgi:hypothetical protein